MGQFSVETYSRPGSLLSGNQQPYILDKIREDYRLQLPSGLMTTIAAYAVLTLNPAIDRLLLALLRRNIAAVDDWNSFAAVANYA